MAKKFKILAAGDIHGDTELVKKLAKKAKKENVDLVILAGDITFLENSIDNLIGPFERVKKQVLIIPGNHESVATTNLLTEIYSNTRSIHGYAVKIKDVGVFGAGGANIGPFSRMKESELYDLLKRGFDSVKDSKIKIMATHMHPSNSLIEKITPFFKGSSGIERAIKKFKPDIAICAHIHEAWGVEDRMGDTLLINVGREGKIIEI
jgi:uncharacterized protein